MPHSDIDLRYQSLWREPPADNLPRGKKPRNDIDIIVPFQNLNLTLGTPTATLFVSNIIPPTLSLILVPMVPTINAPFIIPKGDFVLSTTAPILVTPNTISPSKADLIISSVEPMVSIFIMPPSGFLTITPSIPIDEVSDRKVPITQHLLISTIAPSVSVVFTSFVITPTFGSLNETGFAPTVSTPAGLNAPTITTIRTVSSENTFWNIANGGSTSSNEVSIIGTSEYLGAQVTVFRDGVSQGTTITNASTGNWSFALPSVSDGGPYQIRASMISSPLSNIYSFSVGALISNFTNTPGNDISIAPSPPTLWNVQSAAVSYNISNPDTHTLRFEVRSGERFTGDFTSVDRSEIKDSATFQQGVTLYFTCQFMYEAGSPNGANMRATIVELRNLDDDLPAQYLHFTGKVLEFSILQEKLSLGLRYCPTTLDPNSNSTSITPWTATTDIVRGQWYKLDIVMEARNDTTGFCRLWVDGVQVVNYTGPIGYGPYRNFWRAGMIRDTQSNPLVVRLKNMLRLASIPPVVPIINFVRPYSTYVNGQNHFDVARGGTTYSNLLMIIGVATPNTQVTVQNNGSTIGTTTADGNGNWTFLTGNSNANTSLFTTDGAKSLVAITADGTSASYAFTINPNVTSFTTTPDATFFINGIATYNQSAGQSWSMQYTTGNHDFRFELRAGDHWPSDYSTTVQRAQASMHYFQNDVVNNQSFEFMVESGSPTVTAGWGTLYWESEQGPQPLQYSIRANDDMWYWEVATYPPPLATQTGWDNIFTWGSPQRQSADKNIATLVKGKWYAVTIRSRYNNTTGVGFCQVWMDGVLVLNYTGNLGATVPPAGTGQNWVTFGPYRNTQSGTCVCHIRNYLHAWPGV